MIPDEAIKVAKAAILYVTVGELTTEEADILARAALEAAAPHLTRAAHESAWDEGYNFCLGIVPDGVTGNPYRKAPDA